MRIKIVAKTKKICKDGYGRRYEIDLPEIRFWTDLDRKQIVENSEDFHINVKERIKRYIRAKYDSYENPFPLARLKVAEYDFEPEYDLNKYELPAIRKQVIDGKANVVVAARKYYYMTNGDGRPFKAVKRTKELDKAFEKKNWEVWERLHDEIEEVSDFLRWDWLIPVWKHEEPVYAKVTV